MIKYYYSLPKYNRTKDSTQRRERKKEKLGFSLFVVNLSAIW